MKKVFLTTVVSLMMCVGVYAQDYLNPPKANEMIIGTVKVTKPWASYLESFAASSKPYWYKALLEQAQNEYPGKSVDIRNMEVGGFYEKKEPFDAYYYGPAVGKVVLLNCEEHISNCLSQALTKAVRNVREGSRMAIDQVSVARTIIDRETFKDQLIDMLLDNGYKIVAKEYLEKLYKEQKDQQSGLYNESTTVQSNNFSAVGYFINVKVTETSIRVQVVNVSTGEYEGNATVNF